MSVHYLHILKPATDIQHIQVVSICSSHHCIYMPWLCARFPRICSNQCYPSTLRIYCNIFFCDLSLCRRNMTYVHQLALLTLSLLHSVCFLELPVLSINFAPIVEYSLPFLFVFPLLLLS